MNDNGQPRLNIFYVVVSLMVLAVGALFYQQFIDDPRVYATKAEIHEAREEIRETKNDLKDEWKCDIEDLKVELRYIRNKVDDIESRIP